MKKVFLITIWILLAAAGAQAQVMPADSLPSLFQRWETRLGELDYEDPEIVSLHYLFLQDILKQMDKVGEQLNVTLARSPKTDFYAVKREFRRIEDKAARLNELLSEAKSQVDHTFYLRAVDEMAYRDTGITHFIKGKSSSKAEVSGLLPNPGCSLHDSPKSP